MPDRERFACGARGFRDGMLQSGSRPVPYACASKVSVCQRAAQEGHRFAPCVVGRFGIVARSLVAHERVLRGVQLRRHACAGARDAGRTVQGSVSNVPNHGISQLLMLAGEVTMP